MISNTSNYLYNQNNNKSILSNDFIKKIKKYFNNENEYHAFINKVNNLKKNGKNYNSKYLYLLRKYNQNPQIY